LKNFIKINNGIFLLALILWLVILLIRCDKEVSRSPVESEAPKGFIYINSTPSGFTIFQNGRNTGRLTPDSISYIDAGIYEITLKKKYFKDTSVVVNLLEDEKLSVYVDILSNPSMYGGVYLQTIPPGANITFNDSVLNKVTPLIIQNLLPGEYRVKFDLFNHRDSEIKVIVKSSQRANYTQALRDTSVWVDYQVFNSGIQSNSLISIAIDNNNVKWIGTLDRGLIKYDGVNFINYNKSNSQIPGDRVNCVTIDDRNRVWVGTDDGIAIFDGNSWIVYNESNSGLTNSYINKIRFYNNGTAWIGTAGNLVKFDGINWSVYDQPAGKDWINDIYIENENKLFLGTKMDGIFLFENQTFTWLRWFDYIYCTMTVTSIEKDKFNEVWFCFNPDTIHLSGISIWNGSTFTNIHFGTLQMQYNFSNIFIDDENNKLIATSIGLVIYDNQNISTFYNTSNSLISSNNVSASAVDSRGDIWILTVSAGLNKYRPPN